MDLEDRHLGQPHQGRRVVDQWVRVHALAVVFSAAVDPRRRGAVQVALEERVAGTLRGADAVHPPLPGRRPARGQRHQKGSDAQEMVDDLLLRGPRLGIENLVRMCHPHPVTPDLHLDSARPRALVTHGPTLAPVDRVHQTRGASQRPTARACGPRRVITRSGR